MKSTATQDDVIGTRPRADETAGLPLFGDRPRPTPTLEAPRPAARPATVADGDRHPFLRRTDEDRQEAIETVRAKILPALLERARLRKNRWENPGITADDVIALAKEVPQAALLGQQQRAWSWVGPWLASVARAGQLAELVRGGQVVRRRSTRPGAHGNLGIVYVDPSDFDAAPRREGAA